MPGRSCNHGFGLLKPANRQLQNVGKQYSAWIEQVLKLRLKPFAGLGRVSERFNAALLFNFLQSFSSFCCSSNFCSPLQLHGSLTDLAGLDRGHLFRHQVETEQVLDTALGHRSLARHGLIRYRGADYMDNRVCLFARASSMAVWSSSIEDGERCGRIGPLRLMAVRRTTGGPCLCPRQFIGHVNGEIGL